MPSWCNMILGSTHTFWRRALIYGAGFGGFYCTFKNNTEKTVRIVWDESSLNYNGSTYVPFIEGQKYIDAQNPMSPAAITKNGSISKGVYSSNQPHYSTVDGLCTQLMQMKFNFFFL